MASIHCMVENMSFFFTLNQFRLNHLLILNKLKTFEDVNFFSVQNFLNKVIDAYLIEQLKILTNSTMFLLEKNCQ